MTLRPLTNSPILALSLVKCTSGTVAKMSVRLMTTCGEESHETRLQMTQHSEALLIIWAMDDSRCLQVVCHRWEVATVVLVRSDTDVFFQLFTSSTVSVLRAAHIACLSVHSSLQCAKTHLAEDQQLPGGCVAADAGDDGGGDDGDAAGHRASEPGFEPYLDHALHHHLPRDAEALIMTFRCVFDMTEMRRHPRGRLWRLL